MGAVGWKKFSTGVVQGDGMENQGVIHLFHRVFNRVCGKLS
jgi:hypothetical protein